MVDTRHQATYQDLWDQGFYNEAIAAIEGTRRLEALPVDQVILLIDLYIIQGYVNKALAVSSSPTLLESTNELFQRWTISILHCYVKAIASADFAQSVRQAKELIRDATDFLETNPLHDHTRTILLYYYKLLSLGDIFQTAEYATDLSGANNKCAQLFELLVRSHKLTDALRVAGAFKNQDERREKLQVLIQIDNISNLLRAKIQADLANTLPDQEREQRALLRSLARPVLVEHYHRGLDIELAQYYDDFMAGTGGTDPTYFSSLIERYEKLDYPNGMKWLMERCMIIAAKLNNNTFQQKAQKELKELSVATGTKALWAVFYLMQIAQHASTSGIDDLVKTSLLDSFEELDLTAIPYLRGWAAQLLATAFLQRANYAEAVRWSRVCEEAWSSCVASTSSLGRSQRLKIESFALLTGQSQDYASLQALCESYAAADLKNGLAQSAITNLETGLQIVQSALFMPQEEKEQRMSSILSQISEMIRTSDLPDKETSLANKYRQEANLLLNRGSQRLDCEMEYAAIAKFQKAADLYGQATGNPLDSQVIGTQQRIGLLWQSCYVKLRSRDVAKAKEALETARSIFITSLQDWENVGTIAQIADANYLAFSACYAARINEWSTAEEAFKYLLVAEQGFDDRRSEISLSSGLDAVQDKQALAKAANVRDIYMSGFKLCLLEEKNGAAWEWVQKAKARSLSDTLGLGCLVPGSLLRAISADPVAQALYDEEQHLARLLSESTALNRFDLRIQLRETQAKMRANPTLKPLLDLRHGTSLTVHQADDKSNDIVTNLPAFELVFVDWHVQGNEIYLLVKKTDTDPSVHKLDITLDAVQTWIEKYLSTPEGREAFLNRGEDHPSQALRALDGLVKPLDELTTKGSTLVLSPTSPLHRIPLHALRVPGQIPGRRPRPVPLIERNPIVYSSSLTTFIQCCERSAAKTLTARHTNLQFAAVYEELQDVEYDGAEQQIVYEFTQQQASEMNAEFLTGRDVTRQKLSDMWQAADYIYFHGHCLTTPESIVDQSLILSAQASEHADPTSNQVTVADVFRLNLQSPHISLMACESASQQLQAGDEPLGLVTAFLCAGASSVTGTMWPIASATARTFAALFHGELRKARERAASEAADEGSPGAKAAVDLAKALQATVLRMKRDAKTRMLYHWAAFVLHGACFAKAI